MIIGPKKKLLVLPLAGIIVHRAKSRLHHPRSQKETVLVFPSSLQLLLGAPHPGLRKCRSRGTLRSEESPLSTTERIMESSLLSSMSSIKTGSYEAFHGRSLVVQLIPAIGIIAFGAWGLGPLMRVCRVLFLQKSDNSWNKSKEYQVMTSYVQPLLLWGGAVLICSYLTFCIEPSCQTKAFEFCTFFINSIGVCILLIKLNTTNTKVLCGE
ncbi:hypothetical protein LXL04_015979 [Taraxacum kok-saghyz]